MNCNEIRSRLPVYCLGDTEPNEVMLIEAHLQGCVECRREASSFRGLLRLLDQVPVPVSSFDVPEFYRRVSVVHQTQARRWRRVAVWGLSAAAAILVLLLFSRLEFRLEAHQVVLRWGQPSNLPIAPVAGFNVVAYERQMADFRDNLHAMSQLLHAQCDEFELHQEKLLKFERRIREFQRVLSTGLERWRSTERDVAALTGMQSPGNSKGESHD